MFQIPLLIQYVQQCIVYSNHSPPTATVYVWESSQTRLQWLNSNSTDFADRRTKLWGWQMECSQKWLEIYTKYLLVFCVNTRLISLSGAKTDIFTSGDAMSENVIVFRSWENPIFLFIFGFPLGQLKLTITALWLAVDQLFIALCNLNLATQVIWTLHYKVWYC